MRVSKIRWGEVNIRKQGEGKNIFDAFKSFSIQQTETNYSLDEYFELLKIATDLSEKIPFENLKNKLSEIK